MLVGKHELGFGFGWGFAKIIGVGHSADRVPGFLGQALGHEALRRTLSYAKMLKRIVKGDGFALLA